MNPLLIKKSGGGTFTYKAQVTKITTVTPNYNALKFTGFDASGNKIERIYEMGSAKNANTAKTDNKLIFEVKIWNDSSKGATATFYNDGKLTLQLKDGDGNDITIELALKGKSTTEDKTTQP